MLAEDKQSKYLMWWYLIWFFIGKKLFLPFAKAKIAVLQSARLWILPIEIEDDNIYL